MIVNWWKVGRVEQHNRRLRRMCARILRSTNFLEQFGSRPAAYTLTYRQRGRLAWTQGEISEMLDKIRQKYRVRKRYAGHNLRYVWVAELQRDGTPHFHLILWDLPLLHLDKEGWTHGFTSCDGRARNGAAYAVSYAGKLSKRDQKRDAFPKGMRISGMGGLTEGQKMSIRIASLPTWAQAIGGVKRWCGKIVTENGDILRSPYWVTRSGQFLTVYDSTKIDDTTRWEVVQTRVAWELQLLYLKTGNTCYLQNVSLY